MRQKSELRSYQQRVIKHLYEHDEAMAVLKMGAGKSISTLTAIVELIQDSVIRHALVIAPKRVATIVWPTEIKLWAHTAPFLKYEVLDGDPRQRMRKLGDSRTRDMTIVGIDNVQWLVDLLKPLPVEHPIFDCLVIDETSRLKDPRSKRAKALSAIAGRFKIRWGLTGTPMPNSLLDLFTPAKIITDGRLWGRSFYKWQTSHFYPGDRHGYTWHVLPGHEKQLLADAASIAIALGEGDMPDLPDLSVLIDEVTLPPDARTAYDRMEKHLLADVDRTTVLAASKAVAVGKTAQIANGFLYDEAGAAGAHTVHDEKAAWLEELVADLDGEPAIVVFEYREDLTMIRRLFGDVPYLGAGVSDKQAQAAVEAWNRRELSLFAIHPASGGHGLNLQQGGSRMIWLAPCWSSEYWSQTIARLHRPGQTAHVMIHVCCAANTIDQMKRDRVIGKMSAQEAFEKYLAARAFARAA
jgi:SNF2-related domain